MEEFSLSAKIHYVCLLSAFQFSSWSKLSYLENITFSGFPVFFHPTSINITTIYLFSTKTLWKLTVTWIPHPSLHKWYIYYYYFTKLFFGLSTTKTIPRTIPLASAWRHNIRTLITHSYITIRTFVIINEAMISPESSRIKTNRLSFSSSSLLFLVSVL